LGGEKNKTKGEGQTLQNFLQGVTKQAARRKLGGEGVERRKHGRGTVLGKDKAEVSSLPILDEWGMGVGRQGWSVSEVSQAGRMGPC